MLASYVALSLIQVISQLLFLLLKPLDFLLLLRYYSLQPLKFRLISVIRFFHLILQFDHLVFECLFFFLNFIFRLQ